MRLPIVMLIVMAQAPSSPQFELVQPELFAAAGGSPTRGRTSTATAIWICSSDSRTGSPIACIATTADDSWRSRRRRGLPTSPTHAPRRGATSTATATSICTSASHVARKRATVSIATTAVAPTSRTSPRPSASMRLAKRARCRGSTTTTTATSICSSRSAMRRTCCSATMADGSRASARSSASTIRAAPSGRCGSTSTKTGISISSWPTRTAMPTDCSATTARGSWTWRAELGVDAPGRPETAGSNGPSVADVDGDGHLDLFVAGYGANFLYRNVGRGLFVEAAARVGVQGGDKATPSRWGDYDNDGRPDLYVSSYVDQPIKEHDFLFHREGGGRFVDVLPTLKLPHGATHGVQWVDFDDDGDLDLVADQQQPDRRASAVSESARLRHARGSQSKSGSSTTEAATRARGRRCASMPLERGGCSARSGRYRQRLLLAERDARAHRPGIRCACGHRSDVDVEDAPRRDAAGGRHTGSGRVDGSYAGVP